MNLNFSKINAVTVYSKLLRVPWGGGRAFGVKCAENVICWLRWLRFVFFRLHIVFCLLLDVQKASASVWGEFSSWLPVEVWHAKTNPWHLNKNNRLAATFFFVGQQRSMQHSSFPAALRCIYCSHCCCCRFFFVFFFFAFVRFLRAFYIIWRDRRRIKCPPFVLSMGAAGGSALLHRWRAFKRSHLCSSSLSFATQ